VKFQLGLQLAGHLQIEAHGGLTRHEYHPWTLCVITAILCLLQLPMNSGKCWCHMRVPKPRNSYNAGLINSTTLVLAIHLYYSQQILSHSNCRSKD